MATAASLTRLFIGGEWVEAASGETAEATSPATGESLGPVAQGDREDARRAIDAACAAFPAWAAATAFERADALSRIADVCHARRDELARICTLDQGKPIAESYDEVDELVAMLRGAAEDGIRIEGSIPPSSGEGKRVLLMRRPKGPVAVITPWNWPYTMPAEIVAPALACGNTVVWTPAPSTAVCSGLLAECVAEADLPPGVFNFVTGPGPVVGDELVGHADIAGVGFIGSTQTGLPKWQAAAGKAQPLGGGGNGPRRAGQGAAARDGGQRPARRDGGRRRRGGGRGGRHGLLPVRGAELHRRRAAARPRRRARRLRPRAGRAGHARHRARRPVRARDDAGPAQQRAGRGEDGRARRRRGAARRERRGGRGAGRRAPDRGALARGGPRRAAGGPAPPRPRSPGPRRSSTACPPTPARRPRRRSGRSRRSSGSRRSRR